MMMFDDQATGADSIMHGASGLLKLSLALVPSPLPYAVPVSIAEVSSTPRRL
jgi:hypothetical protein